MSYDNKTPRWRRPSLRPEQEREVLRLHVDERISSAEIASRFGCSGATILRILHRHGLSPRNATAAEKRLIVRLSAQRRTQREIAEFLGRSLSFVESWQRKLGCQRKHKPTKKDEARIVELYRSGKGQAAVASITGVPERAVRETLRARGIPIHATGGQPILLTPRQFWKFRKAVYSKKFYAKDIAKQFGLTDAVTLRMVKEILGVPSLLRGAILPRLSSDFPQVDAQPSHYVQLVKRVCDVCFNGELLATEYDGAFVDLCMEAIPTFQNQPQPVLELLASNLRLALDTLRTQRESPWVH